MEEKDSLARGEQMGGRNRFWFVAMCGLLFSCGFEGDGVDQQSGTIVTQYGTAVVISKDDPFYSKYELPQESGECKDDVGCETGGCGDVCTTAARAPHVVSQCEPHPGKQFFCGCHKSACLWQVDPEYNVERGY